MGLLSVLMWGAEFLPGRGDPGVCLLGGGAWGQSGWVNAGIAWTLQEGTDVAASLLCGLWKWQELVDIPGKMQRLFILQGQLVC